MPFIRQEEMVRGSPLAGWSGRFFHSENMTFAHWDIADDAVDLHEHRHPQEEVWNVVAGYALLVVGGEEFRLGPGDAAVIPPDTPHRVKVLGACRAVIADFPLRPDLPGVGHVEPRRT